MRRYKWLEQVIKDNGLKRVIEVGVNKGRTARHLMQACPGLEMWGVDAYTAIEKGEPTYGHLDHDLNERRARTIEKDFPGKYHLFKGKSPDAAVMFEDGEFDLVFIDGDHSYEAVKADIEAWKPKVREGGWLCGHDYDHPEFPGVTPAVDELLGTPERGPDDVWYVRC